MLRAFRQLRHVVDDLLGLPRVPPLAPALDMCAISSQQSSSKGYSLENIINDCRILWGVPKFRTSKPKKITRKFSYTRVLSPVDDLVTCNSCGEYHQPGTICGGCYKKVRELTNEIKLKLMNYNPYKGERQDKQVFVKFSDDVIDEGVLNGKRIIEMEKERPTWFKRIL